MEERHEIIEFPDNSPIKVFLHRLGNVNRHWHNSLEILFLLSGTLHAVVDDQSYQLREEDLLLINSNSIHSLYSESCELAAFQINLSYFTCDPRLPGLSFDCVSAKSTPENTLYFHRLKHLLAHLLKINEEQTNPLLTLSVLARLLHELEMHFLVPSPFGHTDRKRNLQKLSSITDYIQKHYKDTLTLTKLAEHEHFSVSYLSRFFKEQMGMNFSDYYNCIRLDHAVNELITTKLSIASVAANNGFSDVRTFVSLFKKQYHMLPSDYRSKHRSPLPPAASMQEINYLAITNSDSLKKLAIYLKPESELVKPAASEPSRQIHLGVLSQSQAKGTLRHTFRRLCCVGSARDLLSANVQQLLKYVQKETPFQYIRFHGLFSNDTMIYDESPSGTPLFSFSLLDQLFDFLLGIGLKPVLQLSFTPDALASQPEKCAFYMHYNTSRPKDYDKWCMLVEALLRHLMGRYPLGEVLSWPVSLWNEPDTSTAMFGFETYQDFFELYRRTYETVRGIDPRFQIGSPTLMLFSADCFGFSQAFFSDCHKNNCLPNFINLNYYSDAVDFSSLCDNYSNRITQSRLPTTPDDLKHFFARLPRHAAKYQVEALPIHITEWNLTVNHRNLINDTCFKACYLAKNILENYDAAESFGYWSLTDYISELQPSSHLFHGGLGLFTIQSIPKPPYHALRFLFRLGDQLLGRGEGWFAAQSPGSGEIQIIFYNYCHYTQLFSTGENFDLNHMNRYTIFSHPQKLLFSLTLAGLTAPIYRIREEFVNRRHGSAYDNWLAMGACEDLSPEEIATLRETSRPGLFIHRETPKDHGLDLEVALEPFEVRLVTLQPQGLL